jgi:hypothetical protein
MKRIFIFSIVISCLLINYSVVAAAPEANVPNGKSLYSNRPNRTTLRTWSEDTPVLAPADSQAVVRPVPAMPTPVVPAQPNTSTPDVFWENKTFSNKSSNKSLPDFSDFSSTVPVLAPPNQSNKPESSQEIVVEKSTEVRPLSKIDITPTSTVKTERTEVYKKTDESSGSHFISRPALPNQPVSAEDYKNKQEEQLDELNARLAKIQLEKHNLNETLKLISKIKSSAIKAKTLVDLAEYVSRDNNYKKEADQLFALAVDGVDALTKGEAIVIKIKDDLKKDDLKTESVLSSPVTNIRTPSTPVFAEPKKTTEPTSTTFSPSTSSTPTTSSRKTLSFLDEDKPVESSPETLSNSVSPVVPPSNSAVSSVLSTDAKRSPQLIDDEPETPKLETIKEETSKAKTPTTRKPPLLSLEGTENDINKEKEFETKIAEPVKTETGKKEETTAAKTPTTRRPPLLLTEETEINKDKDKETEKEKETTKKEEPETTKNETIKPSDTPSSNSKPRRSSMPGRPGKTITLEEN